MQYRWSSCSRVSTRRSPSKCDISWQWLEPDMKEARRSKPWTLFLPLGRFQPGNLRNSIAETGAVCSGVGPDLHNCSGASSAHGHLAFSVPPGFFSGSLQLHLSVLLFFCSFVFCCLIYNNNRTSTFAAGVLPAELMVRCFSDHIWTSL